MKLEVGMWVRLNCNYELGIGKIIREIDEDNFIKTKFTNDFECSIPTYMITKASHNIIDLIEVGDYVNGYPVIHKENDILKCGLLVQFKENEIKSIVTKEQFSQMEYKVDD